MFEILGDKKYGSDSLQLKQKNTKSIKASVARAR